jgi:hypothetical protein
LWRTRAATCWTKALSAANIADMGKAIHLINRRDGASLHGMTQWPGEPGGFRSCCWHISDDQAAQLIGGWVYFHEAKATLARFGGLILGFELGEGDMADRKIILFRGDGRSRGVKWRGADHGMAMWSGVIDADLPHEAE